MLQSLLTWVIVGCSAAYVLWAVLLPAALRQRLARTLLRRRWPAALQARLQRAAQASSGCGCDGCDGPPAAKAGQAEQPVRWMPPRRR